MLIAAGLLSSCASSGRKDFADVPAAEMQPGRSGLADLQQVQPAAAVAAERQLSAATVPADNDLAAYKKSRAEFQAGAEAATKKQMGAESIQRDLERLKDQKQTWQREIVYAKGRAAVAKEQLNRFLTVGDQPQIEKWRTQMENWQTRHKAAVLELEKTELEIHDTVKSLQDSFKVTKNEIIMPGESIEVFVKEDDTLSKVYQVRQGGYIYMGNVGRINVAGKTLAEAEQAIKDALAENYIKNATVMVDRPDGTSMNDGQVIYLAGEFVKPGAWKIPVGHTPTIVTTLLRNPYKETADLTKVSLNRLVGGQALVEEVNVQAILHHGGNNGQQSDLVLKPGDIVTLRPFANVIYVSGNVVRPGALKLLPDDELTAYSAILRSGGFARFANRKKVYVIRDMGNGKKIRINVDIKALEQGKGSDLILKSKDIVKVPEKFFSF